jgi:hypothetical protein
LQAIWRSSWKEDGILANGYITVVHFLIVIVFPLPLVILHAWILFEHDTIKSDIHYNYFTVQDIIYPSSTHFWLNDVTYGWTLYISLGIFGGFFFFGILEIISFYFAGFADTGRHPVKNTIPKKILVGFFWFFFFLILSVYLIYTGLVLVWAILGAVLNPSKFLAWGMGSATFMLFIKSKVTNLNDFVQ